MGMIMMFQCMMQLGCHVTMLIGTANFLAAVQTRISCRPFLLRPGNEASTVLAQALEVDTEAAEVKCPFILAS